MIKGIIFDLDGVIISTDEIHYQAWKKLTDELGVPFGRKDNDCLRGISRMDSLEMILKKSSILFTYEQKKLLADRKNRYYINLLAQITEKDIEKETKETLDELKRMGLRMAIGSSSKNAKLILGKIGLLNYFDAISDGTNIIHSKPDPEVFIKAAQFLNLIPAECVVIEDSVSGIEAAREGAFGLLVLAMQQILRKQIILLFLFMI